MSKNYIKVNSLSVSEELLNFVNREAIEGTNLNKKKFWDDFEKAIYKLVPINKSLLQKRRILQLEIDRWHLNNRGKNFNKNYYENFQKIGYLENEGNDIKLKTTNLDYEISKVPGPQLVVPVNNARYLLNDANARYQSLYDSLYGTDVIESEESANERYDPERGLEVIKFSKKFLDKFFTLKSESWKNIDRIYIEDKNLVLENYKKKINLKNKNKFVGYRGSKDKPEAIILKNNNLYIEIIINPYAFSAKSDPAGIADIIIEAAITTICDHEDSVASVDADDKVVGYRNWLGLMKGDLK